MQCAHTTPLRSRRLQFTARKASRDRSACFDAHFHWISIGRVGPVERFVALHIVKLLKFIEKFLTEKWIHFF